MVGNKEHQAPIAVYWDTMAVAADEIQDTEQACPA